MSAIAALAQGLLRTWLGTWAGLSLLQWWLLGLLVALVGALAWALMIWRRPF